MNNDIKEILEFKENADYKRLSVDEITILRDYITNLQEKINQYENPDDMTLFYMWLDTKAKDKMKQLQEENERYKRIFEDKEKFSKIMPDDIDFIILSKADYDRQLEDIELVAIELRNRIDKAIEYIKENCIDDEFYINLTNKEKHIITVLNLLQGENKLIEEKL